MGEKFHYSVVQEAKANVISSIFPLAIKISIVIILTLAVCHKSDNESNCAAIRINKI